MRPLKCLDTEFIKDVYYIIIYVSNEFNNLNTLIITLFIEYDVIFSIIKYGFVRMIL